MQGRFIAIILAAGLFTSLVWGAYRLPDLKTRTVERQLLADTYLAGSDGHVGTAINLLTNGAFYGLTESPLFGLVPRSQIYSLFVALAFVLFGVSLWSVWFLNLIFFLGALAAWYAVSVRFLEKKFAWLPPLFLSLFWGAFEYVWIINTETLTLLAVGLFLLGLLKYKESLQPRWLLLSSLGLAALIVNKGIALYFIAPTLILAPWALRQNFYPRGLWHHWAVFFTVVVAVAGGFMAHNYAALGSTDFSRGGHALLIHSKTAEFRGEKLKGFILSQFLGDFITDKIIPGYAEAPEPLTAQREVSVRWREMRQAGAAELETDRMFWREAKEIVKKNPALFLSVAPWWFLRLNGPVHYNLATIDHVFVGTHEYIPDAVKTAILLIAYGVWFSFVGVCLVYGAKELWKIIRERMFSNMAWLISLTLYFNIMYSVFTHAEVRYILPVMPIYFLFFGLCVQSILTSRRREAKTA